LTGSKKLEHLHVKRKEELIEKKCNAPWKKKGVLKWSQRKTALFRIIFKVSVKEKQKKEGKEQWGSCVKQKVTTTHTLKKGKSFVERGRP